MSLNTKKDCFITAAQITQVYAGSPDQKSKLSNVLEDIYKKLIELFNGLDQVQ